MLRAEPAKHFSVTVQRLRQLVLGGQQHMFYICSMMDNHVVWFRNDLRLHDHGPLAAALASGGPVLPLFIFDPEDWRQAGRSHRQFAFLTDSLRSLDDALRRRGSALCVRIGPASDVFARLHRENGIAAVHLHEATGNRFALERDRALRNWALKAGIGFREQSGNGVWRGIAPDAHWERAWAQYVRQARFKVPESLPAVRIDTGDWAEAGDFGLPADPCPNREPGGREMAGQVLQNFLSGRARTYRTAPATLAEAEAMSPRLSAHLSFGTVSVREVWQSAERARRALAEDGDTTFVQALANFQDDLLERCRLRQTGQASAEPSVELRESKLFTWLAAQTGFPIMDAGMRALAQTGHGPTLLTDTLIDFACQHLWIDRGLAAQALATQLTDRDPDFLYARVSPKMAPHPVRVSRRLDPDGQFIRHWLPELRALSGPDIHAPWDAARYRLKAAGIVLGQTYPMRMVDHAASFRREPRPSTRRPVRMPAQRQLSLDFGPAPTA